jgi:hypothetical protein
MAGEKACFEQRRLADLLADFASTAPLCDDFVTKRQKFSQMPPVTVTVY